MPSRTPLTPTPTPTPAPPAVRRPSARLAPKPPAKAPERTTRPAPQIPAPSLPAVKTPGPPQPPETRLRRLARRRGVQTALFVSSPGDAREQEADEAARRVLSMGAHPGAQTGAQSGTQASPRIPTIGGRALKGGLFRSALSPALPSAPARPSAPAGPRIGGGEPLPAPVRSFMEPRFGADFSAVRIHTGARAATLNQQVGARAFTIGSDIYFGRGQYEPQSSSGRGLIAHELAHTVQQGAAPQSLQRSALDVPLIRAHAPFGVQRLGLSDALDFFADAANAIPGFRMFTIILGVNPINMSGVDRSPANILRAVIEFMPGGNLITRALDSYGIIDKAAGWVAEQIATLGMTGSLIKSAIDRFLDSLSWSDIFDLGGVWERAKRIFTEPIDKIVSFVVNLVSGILGFIKDALLMPLARLAEGTQGYDLLKAVLGQDPITGEAVPRSADTLIGGFMKLIGQEEIWNNIKKANAIARAWAWFQTALAGLVALVSSIPGRFMELLQSLTIEDVVLIAGAFKKVAGAFAGYIGDFLSWAGGTVLSLLQIIFEVVAPQAVPYVAKAAGAFKTIIQNPIGFVGNLVKAGMMGLRQFMGGFLGHLKAALINWLTGSLAGANVYIPKAFSIVEILKFVLSVLGLTWQNIRTKLVKAIGETAVKVLETTFDIVVVLVREGPAAAWQKIVEGVGDLKQMAIDAVMDYVKEKIVTAAITKLLSMLSPAGAFIQAIIAIYNTIMFFIERLKTIMQVAMSFIDSIAAIAAGSLGAAANRVEQTMAGLLVLVISFLARIAGLGKVSDAVKKLIDKIRSPIDKALDKVIAWIVAQAKKLGKLVAEGAAAIFKWWTLKGTFSDKQGKSHRVFFSGEGAAARLKIASAEMFTEEFEGKVVAAMAADPLARSLGTMPLKQVRDAMEVIKTQRARLATLGPTARSFERIDPETKLRKAMEGIVAPLRILYDILPENQAATAPVKAGDFVTLPYKGTERRAEILVVSNLRVRYAVPAVKGSMEMETTAFAAAWGKTIYEYVEGSLREQYLGATPGKGSKTGRDVIARYENATPKKIRTSGGLTEVEWKPGTWHDLLDCDMSHHPVDAVVWWNSTGKHTGPKSSTVRTWMLDPNNYMLEPSAINQLRGAKTKDRYEPPTV